MAHFAQIRTSDDVVLRVVVVNNEDVDANGGDYSSAAETWVSENIVDDPRFASDGATYWKQTSYNSNARFNYCGDESTYDSGNDAFINPQPYSTFTLDSNFVWKAPIADPATYEVDGVGLIISYDNDNIRWLGYKDDGVYPEYAWNNSTSVWDATGNTKPF